MNLTNISVLYALACVMVPILWGVGIVFVINLLDRRKPQAKAEPNNTLDPSVHQGPEYHI